MIYLLILFFSCAYPDRETELARETCVRDVLNEYLEKSRYILRRNMASVEMYPKGELIVCRFYTDRIITPRLVEQKPWTLINEDHFSIDGNPEKVFYIMKIIRH